jgi:hypothetical protein
MMDCSLLLGAEPSPGGPPAAGGAAATVPLLRLLRLAIATCRLLRMRRLLLGSWRGAIPAGRLLCRVAALAGSRRLPMRPLQQRRGC